MAEKELKTRIGLRRDLESNFSSDFIPLKGEVLLVDTSSGLRVKVGNGVTTFINLPYLDEDNNVILVGYYLNGEFYTDSTYTVELEHSNVKLYIDKNTNKLFMYLGDGIGFAEVAPDAPQATDITSGVMKLYKAHGQNEDGTMTQKAITNGIDDIEFAIDSQDDECLILSKP